MKEFLGKQVTEEEHGMGIAYLLENNELFYDIGYKVMQNLEETYLLKCHRDIALQIFAAVLIWHRNGGDDLLIHKHFDVRDVGQQGG